MFLVALHAQVGSYDREDGLEVFPLVQNRYDAGYYENVGVSTVTRWEIHPLIHLVKSQFLALSELPMFFSLGLVTIANTNPSDRISSQHMNT